MVLSFSIKISKKEENFENSFLFKKSSKSLRYIHDLDPGPLFSNPDLRSASKLNGS